MENSAPAAEVQKPGGVLSREVEQKHENASNNP